MLVSLPSESHADVLYQTGFESPTFSSGGDLVGVDGWLGINTAIGSSSGVISDGSGPQSGILGTGFNPLDQAAFVGFNAPPLGEDVYAWKPINLTDPVGNGKQYVTFSVDLAIVQSTSGGNDTFSFTVYNTDGLAIAGIDFSTNSNAIRNAITGESATTTFAFSQPYKLQIDIDFSTQKWTATLDDTTVLFNSVSLDTVATYDLGDIDAVWAISNPANPGDNYLVFDNYTITAIPEPGSTSLALGGAVLLGAAMLMRRRRKV
jgi:hypothetical protein